MGLKHDYLTISEAAAEIGVTRQSISRWLKEGRLPSESVGRVKLIHKKDLINVYKDDKIIKIVFEKLFPRIEKSIRKEFNYTKEDKIDTIFHMPERGYFTFIVSRKDGNLDKIRFYVAYERGEGLKASKIVREQYTKSRGGKKSK